MVDLTFEETSNIVKKLEREKVIVQYSADINWRRVDGHEGVTAMIDVKVAPKRGVGFDEIAERIYRFQEVKSVYLMSGAYDLSVIIEEKSMSEVAFFVSEKLSTLDSVLSTTTHFIMKNTSTMVPSTTKAMKIAESWCLRNERALVNNCTTAETFRYSPLFDLAASMDNVISLGVGEPDFVTSWAVREASILSLERGYTSYTANAGLLELRFEIMKYMKRNFNVSYDYKDDIIVTVGGSQALDITMRALINPEDEIIVVEPNFVSYSPLISLAGGVPVAIETTAETEFKLQPRQIEEVITSNTKALLYVLLIIQQEVRYLKKSCRLLRIL